MIDSWGSCSGFFCCSNCKNVASNIGVTLHPLNKIGLCYGGYTMADGISVQTIGGECFSKWLAIGADEDTSSSGVSVCGILL